MSRANKILEQRRAKNHKDLDNRKQEVYTSSPRIHEIEKELEKLNHAFMQALINTKDTKDIGIQIEKLRKEKIALMNELGYDKDYLNIKYHCDICKDTGANNGKICQCKKKLLIETLYDQSSIKQRLDMENFSNFKLNVFRKSRQAGEDLSPYENMRIIKAEMQKYVKNYASTSPSLFLYGQVGTGKTFMVNCIAKELMDKGVSVLYQSAQELLQTLTSYQFMYSEDKKQNTEKIEFIFSVDVLIIDDLGTESTNDVVRANLFEIINKRLVNEKTTIISSNIDLYDLSIHYDDRINSRIMGEYVPFYFYGNDLRMA
ncbi:MAG: ATP-binding protein [Tissierellia bacterium]|nr:ATP-binding protein [Tissierellia bacterium]